MVKYTYNDFYTKSIKVHGLIYDYQEVVYVNSRVEITIICPAHGSFRQAPYIHMRGSGCPHCSIDNKALDRRKTKTYFVHTSIMLHKGKYDYRNVFYISDCTPVSIVCPDHGVFMQTPSNHLKGLGCNKCHANILIK